MAYASQAVQLLQRENIRLKERVQVLEDENRALESYIGGITTLYEATQTFTHHNDVMKLLDEILYQALVVINTHHGSILLADEDTEELAFVLVHGDLRETLEGYRLPWNEGIAGAAIQSGEPQVVNHTRYDPRFSQNVDRTFGMKSDQLLAVPMISGTKRIGVIELVNKRDGTGFTDSDATLLALLARFAAVSLDQLDRQLQREENAA